MATTSSNTALAPDLATLCHQFYAIGAEMVKFIVNEGISNTTANSVCAQVKADRGTVNTFHTTILTNFAGQ
jgi:hypothetical protein